MRSEPRAVLLSVPVPADAEQLRGDQQADRVPHEEDDGGAPNGQCALFNWHIFYFIRIPTQTYYAREITIIKIYITSPSSS
jgi:hypothetical protein